MGLFSILGKGIQAMINEATTPESFKVGQKFEAYVREYIFTEKKYVLVHRTHDYHTNKKDYVESSKKPDFTFRDKISGKEFYVEAKFRTDEQDGNIVWCKDWQLKRYKEYNKEKPVFIIIGLGSDPTQPDVLYSLPIKAAKYTGLYPSYVDEFEIVLDKSISSKELWNL